MEKNKKSTITIMKRQKQFVNELSLEKGAAYHEYFDQIQQWNYTGSCRNETSQRTKNFY